MLSPPHAALLATVGVLMAGCPDPSLYHSSGTLRRTRTASARRSAASSRDTQAEGEDVRVGPTRTGGKARKGDIRVFPATPTQPGSSPNNVAIVIQKIAANVRTVTAGNLAFRRRGENVGVRGGAPLARRNGLDVAVAGEDFRARLQAEHRRRRSSTRQQMFITVVSGMEGQIAVGQNTFVERLGYFTPHGFHVLVERAFVGRALVVRPTILDNGLIRVEVWPRFTTRSRRGAIDVTELKTTAVVRDGQSMVIGGLNTGRDDVGTVLFGVERDRRSSTMTMVLTPKIGGMDIDWPEGMR